MDDKTRQLIRELRKKGAKNESIAQVLGVEIEEVKSVRNEPRRIRTKEEKKKIAELHNAGKSTAEIARETGRTITAVNQIIREEVYGGKRRRRRFTEEEKKIIATLTTSGYDVNSIAKIVNHEKNPQAVYEIVRKVEGNSIKKKRRLTREDKAKILELKKDGRNPKEIANCFGVHWTTIYKVIDKEKNRSNPSLSEEMNKANAQ